MRQVSGFSTSSGAALQRRRAAPREVRSRRASSASPRSLGASRRVPGLSAWHTRPNSSSLAASWDARRADTPMMPASSCREAQGQSESRSKTRFSVGPSSVGSSHPGAAAGAKSRSMPAGNCGCDSGSSWGSRPPRSTRERIWRRSRTAETEGGRHTGESGPARAASRSRARKTGKDAPASIRRAWRSRTRSGTSARRPAGRGPSPSRHNRLPNPVRSAVFPWRMMATECPPGRTMPASIDAARKRRTLTGKAALAMKEARR